MLGENRKYKRLPTKVNRNATVKIMPPPPYVGDPLSGQLENLSEGGMGLLISQKLEVGRMHKLQFHFPDLKHMELVIQVRHVEEKGSDFYHGIQFMSLSDELSAHINRMTNDYTECENRIKQRQNDPCKLFCTFYPLCKKLEKYNPTLDFSKELSLTFK